MQVKDIVLVGYFSEIQELATRMGVGIRAVVDPTPIKKLEPEVSYYMSDEEFLASATSENVFLTPDLPKVRKALYNLYSNAGHNLISLRCPSSMVSPTANFGASCCIQAGVNISSHVILGIGVKVNCLANVMHNCTIGDYTTIAPSAVLLGGVSIGDCSYIGANATILPNLTIGSGVMVGAGSVVTKNVPDNCVIYGNPARKSR